MQRGAPLGAGFRKGEDAAIELQQRERIRRFLAWEHPSQPAGDHQMQHEVQRAFEHEHDALADAADLGDALALGARDRRHRGAQDERVHELHPLQHAAGDTALQSFDVDRDVGQLGHTGSVSAGSEC